MLALSVLLLFLHYPIYRDDYRTSQTALHCKLFTDFMNRPCLRGLRNKLLSLCLEVEAILVLCNLADSFAKFYSQTFLSLYHIIIYMCILALFIYKYSMKVDYVDLIPVVTG